MAITYAGAGFRLSLLGAIGQHLQAQGVAKWTTPWALTDTAITVDALPAGSTGTPASPDKAIALVLYDVEHSAGTDTVMGLQCRVRGKPNNRTEDKDLVDGLFDALHGLENITWGGVPIVRVWHQSGAYLGTDTANRPEHSHNFYIQLTRTGTNRSD
jgi:hypothetical protein